MDPVNTLSQIGDDAPLMLSVLVFLATGTLAFAVMIGLRAREAVRRRGLPFFFVVATAREVCRMASRERRS